MHGSLEIVPQNIFQDGKVPEKNIYSVQDFPQKNDWRIAIV